MEDSVRNEMSGYVFPAIGCAVFIAFITLVIAGWNWIGWWIIPVAIVAFALLIIGCIVLLSVGLKDIPTPDAMDYLVHGVAENDPRSKEEILKEYFEREEWIDEQSRLAAERERKKLEAADSTSPPASRTHLTPSPSPQERGEGEWRC